MTSAELEKIAQLLRVLNEEFAPPGSIVCPDNIDIIDANGETCARIVWEAVNKEYILVVVVAS